MDLILVGFCLAAIVLLYFYNNPMDHKRWFMIGRFINWFPLGMTYAFLYMGRYNLTVSKNALGGLMTKEDFGVIFAAGTWVYALSFLVNGPLIDNKLGGKRGIIIAAIGSSMANIAMGVLTWMLVTGRLHTNVKLAFSVIYGINMYFQSYGAVSIIKVKAYWFHVRERGVFGAIFGTLISFGVYFAFDWGAAIVNATSINPKGELGGLTTLIRSIFVGEHPTFNATWAVFFVPAALLLVWAVIDAWLIKDTPEDAGFAAFDTADASSGQMHLPLTTEDLLKKVFTSKLMLLIAFIEITSGVLRNGIMQWYQAFMKETKFPVRDYAVDHWGWLPDAVRLKLHAMMTGQFFTDNWGLLLCIFGIIGGFAGGLVSDKLFQSRRAPPVVIFCAIMFGLTGLMVFYLHDSPFIVGSSAVLIVMAVIGVHSLMSGTAATDFGGRKATATCAGIVDGFAYLGSSIQSVSIGYLASKSWLWWPAFLMPFALLGGVIALFIWNELPTATRKYIAEKESPIAGLVP
jgi:OPA family glycerol-3-phosphate transporter-like MFS transporter